MNCDTRKDAFFSVTASDPEGIDAVFVQLYTKDNTVIMEIPLDGFVPDNYSGVGFLPDPYTVYEVYYYQFRAVDNSGDETNSQAYDGRSEFCSPPSPTPETPIAQLN